MLPYTTSTTTARNMTGNIIKASETTVQPSKITVRPPETMQVNQAWTI